MVFKKREHPDGMYEFVSENAAGNKNSVLRDMVNERFGTDYTEAMIAHYKHVNNIYGFKGKFYPNPNKGRWYGVPDEVGKYIEENQYGISRLELSNQIKEKFDIDISPSRLMRLCSHHGLKNGIVRKAGDPAINKGMKWSEESRRKILGRKPINTMPEGAERYNSDGSTKYWQVKVNGKWVRKSRYLWEQAYGKIPDGCVIIYKDSNPNNCVLENLLMIKRSDMATMVNMDMYSEFPEVTEAAAAIAAINNGIKSRRKNNERCSKNREHGNRKL